MHFVLDYWAVSGHVVLQDFAFPNVLTRRCSEHPFESIPKMVLVRVARISEKAKNLMRARLPHLWFVDYGQSVN